MQLMADTDTDENCFGINIFRCRCRHSRSLLFRGLRKADRNHFELFSISQQIKIQRILLSSCFRYEFAQTVYCGSNLSAPKSRDSLWLRRRIFTVPRKSARFYSGFRKGVTGTVSLPIFSVFFRFHLFSFLVVFFGFHPVLPFLVFGKRHGKPSEKQGFFYPYQTPTNLGKEGKNAKKKTRNSSQGEKTRNSKKTRKRRTGHFFRFSVVFWFFRFVSVFFLFFSSVFFRFIFRQKRETPFERPLLRNPDFWAPRCAMSSAKKISERARG